MEGAYGAVGDAGRDGDEEEEVDLWVDEAFTDLVELEVFVLDTMIKLAYLLGRKGVDGMIMVHCNQKR